MFIVVEAQRSFEPPINSSIHVDSKRSLFLLSFWSKVGRMSTLAVPPEYPLPLKTFCWVEMSLVSEPDSFLVVGYSVVFVKVTIVDTLAFVLF